jgi:uncharacterized RDD family membrane protein YckC
MMTNVGPGKRVAYTLFDSALYTAVTLGLARLFGWRPVFDFMGAYTPEQQSEYWSMFWLAMLIVSATSFTLHAKTGQSIGKRLFGAKSVRLDGSPLGAGGTFKRLLYIWMTMLFVFVPGPVLGFAFGNASNLASLTLLWSVVIVTVVIAVKPWHPDRSPLLQPYFGVRTINTNG